MNTPQPTLKSRARQEAVMAFRFAVVGLAATLTHSAVALALHSTGLLPALAANVAGFLTAFSVSFTGHHFWSFAALCDPGRTASRMRRFFLLALAGFLINSGTLLGWLRLTNWPEDVGILVSIAIVPLLSFLGARFWAFKAHTSASAN